jgi:hypothetical protein
MNHQQVTSGVETITPAQAQAYLDNRCPNRQISVARVEEYAARMTQGLWQMNGQTVVFNPEGRLLDGQQRLSAVVKCGLPLTTMVVRGVPDKTFDTMDNGRPRSPSDVIGAYGFHNTVLVASIARASFNYAANANQGKSQPHKVIADFCLQHRTYIQAVADQVKHHQSKLPGSSLGAVLFLANNGHRVFDEKVEAFLEGVKSAANMDKGDPRLTLRNWFYDQRVRAHLTIGDTLIFAAVVRAWNAFATDRELLVIKMLGQPNPRSMPIVGFDLDHFPGVPDLHVNQQVQRDMNLIRAREVRRQAGDDAGREASV